MHKLPNAGIVIPLKIVLAALLVATVGCQLVIIPWQRAGMTISRPAYETTILVYSIAAITTVLCAQVGLVAIWQLVGRSDTGPPTLAQARRRTEVIIAASTAATLLTTTMLLYMGLALGGAGPMIFPMLGITLVSLAVLLLAIRGRGLLVAAERGGKTCAEHDGDAYSVTAGSG